MLEATLQLPFLSSLVPVEVIASTGDPMLGDILTDRAECGLPVVRPSMRHHPTVSDAFMASLKKLTGRVPLSEEYFKLYLDPCNLEISLESGVDLDKHYSVRLESGNIQVRSGVLALNEACSDLGSEALARITKGMSPLPGCYSDKALFIYFDDYCLESGWGQKQTDADILEHLVDCMGWDPEHAQTALPSVVLDEMGGEGLLMYQAKLSNSDFTRCLLEAMECKVSAKRLAQLITNILPKRVKELGMLSQKFTGTQYQLEAYAMKCRLTVADPGSEETAINGFIDQNEEDAMSCGDYDVSYAIDHVGLPVEAGPRQRQKKASQASDQLQARDGLQVIAALIRAYSALDEIVVLINKLGEKYGRTC